MSSTVCVSAPSFELYKPGYKLWWNGLNCEGVIVTNSGVLWSKRNCGDVVM